MSNLQLAQKIEELCKELQERRQEKPKKKPSRKNPVRVLDYNLNLYKAGIVV